jgi:tetratricopeptide (TPR) repeat protein
VILALALALAVSGPAQAQDADGRIRGAVQSYTAGDYEAAAQSWQSLVDEGYATGDLYYNLGNARYRAGDLAGAILSWRRAALLAPRDGDIEANLTRARRQTVDRLEVSPPLSPFFWREMLSLSEQGLAAAWLAGLLLSLGVAQRMRPGLPLGIPGLLVGVPAVLLAASTWSGQRELNRRPGGVVLAPQVDVRSAAGDAAGVVVFQLHEGAEVQIRERLGDYAQISLPDDRRGWVADAELGIIDPRLPMP